MTYEVESAALGKRADDDIRILQGQVVDLQNENARLQAIIDAENSPKPTMLYGTSAPSGIDALEQGIGVRFALRRCYDKTIPTSFANAEAAKDVGKRGSVYSVKISYTSDANIAAGAAALKRLGASWPKGHPGFLLANHEPENDGLPPEQFVKWQRAAVAAWKSVNSHVPIGGNLMSYSTRPSSGRNPEAWICDDWDFLSWDGYSHPPVNPTAEEVFGKAAAISEAHGLPFAICEYATEDPGYKETFTTMVAEFTAAAHGLFACYWNSEGTGKPYTWPSSMYPTVKGLALKYGGTPL